MKNVYVVDDNGNKESIDWHDFLTNNNNPTLKRLGNKLQDDPEFQKVMEENGFNDERTNSTTC